MHYQLIQMNEMISASFNHPCVIFFGFFNEGPSNEVAACPGYQVLTSSRLPSSPSPLYPSFLYSLSPPPLSLVNCCDRRVHKWYMRGQTRTMQHGPTTNSSTMHA